MRTKHKGITLALLLALGLGGCAAESVAGDGVEPGPVGPGAGKEDRWDWRNRPERVTDDLVFDVAALPKEGRAERTVWPSTYWPTYEDSINNRWNGRDELSPAEKYDKAFNGWEPPEGFMDLRPFSRYRPKPHEQWDPEYYEQLGPLAKWVSEHMGNKRDRDAALQANGLPEGDWPVETWWGVCHAWVPASIHEKRPLYPVTYHGVTFYPGDLEALVIAAYNHTSARMIGGRCNRGHGDDYRVERDEYGRVVHNECRDTNPGSLHVILANYLGLRKRAFAEDKTYDYEVWNQPVVAFRVEKMEEITVQKAMDLLERTGDTYVYNEDAKKLYDVKVRVTYLSESYPSTEPVDVSDYERTDTYTYILEVDDQGKVIGGEYYGASRTDHPDFLWDPERLRRSSIPHLDLEKVRMLLDLSQVPPEERQPATGEDSGSGSGRPSANPEVIEVSSHTSADIPDNDPRGIEQRLEVADTGVRVGTVELQIDITHSYRGDLVVELEHGSVRKTVVSRQGGGADDLKDTFTVEGFEGMDAAGPWILHVSDRAYLDHGTLNAWTLRITPATE